jgi:hypothetical protein
MPLGLKTLFAFVSLVLKACIFRIRLQKSAKCAKIMDFLARLT